MAHTPGPWRVNKQCRSVYDWDIIGPNGEDIGFANPSDGLDEPTEYPVMDNARLMAAAPDLLVALQEVLVLLENDDYVFNPTHFQTVEIVKRAIAKAEGR